MSLLVKAENGWHTCHTSPRNRKLRREGIASATVHYVSLAELREIRLLGGALGIERDEHFKATKTLSEYAAAARVAGRIEAY
jgi:hypothetical protein